MNRIFNEGVSSSVSRVSPLNSSGVQQKWRQSCDISSGGPPDGRSAVWPHTNEKLAKARVTFNGIFESNPKSEGSVASDSTCSPAVSPMVALTHTQQSSPAVDNYGLTDDRSNDDNNRVHKRGRKRKNKEVLDPLIEKLDAKRRFQKAPTGDELAQRYNIDVKDVTDSRLVTTNRTNRRHDRHSDVNVGVDSNVDQSKSEMMQRFLWSQSSNTSPAIQEDHDFNYNSHSVADFSDQPVTSAQSVPHPSQSSDQTSYHRHFANIDLHHNQTYHTDRQTVSATDSVGQEIQQILSQLPPLRQSDRVWSDCEPNDDKSSDNESNSEDNRDHNHHRNDFNSDLDSNLSTNDSNKLDNSLRKGRVKEAKEVTDYEVEKYCEERWESVNGTYDHEAEWRHWNQMSSVVSYNQDLLHILPYVDIYSEPDRSLNDQSAEPTNTENDTDE